ncbi:LysR family transcriptional regulator [Rhodococcus sp. IEGM 1381]|uniref:LysR family transcriptional regulator n=1 Tax=Rhodococcus sp. IEGM 1381 TaxID=3047085 RepID=UPI0024B76062|nr:LysR family transcriptional regulator [Rhodococcus sp. IEGM 1381]MDI9894446.1 LysR family transcriptional regulator [Rhodococcus sp. IEGM 1381]
MELRHLQYFLAVVDTGGMSNAAVSMQVSNPSVSQAIAFLERDLGSSLFARVGKGLTLTPAGHALIGPARKVLRDVVSAASAIDDGSGTLRGRLEIAASPHVAAEPVAGLVARFRASHPGTSVRIGALPTVGAVGGLIRDGHCEFVFCHLPVSVGGLATLVLGVHTYWLVFPPGAEVAATDPFPLAELPSRSLVAVPQGSPQRVTVERALHEAGQRTTPSAVVQHREAMIPFVLEGVGTSIMERSLAERAACRGAQVRAVEPAIELTHAVIYDSEALSPVGSAFLASIMEGLAAEGN